MGARNRDAAVAASWQQHHRSLFAPRRSAGTAAAARSCGVAAATATMCAEHSRNDVRCRCVPRTAMRLPICASRPRPLPDPRTASRLPICKACMKCGTAWVVRSLGHGAARSRHHLESAEFHFLGQNVIYILKYLQQRHLYIKVPPRNNCHFKTHTHTQAEYGQTGL